MVYVSNIAYLQTKVEAGASVFVSRYSMLIIVKFVRKNVLFI